MNTGKQAVHDFWDNASCGEELYLRGRSKEDFLEQAKIRYELEPFIKQFADFDHFRNKNVLEIGVGLGADHQMFAEAGADLTGVDLTARAIDHTQKRLRLFGLNSELSVGDAENLSFPDESFELVYSWGVLHHSPDTQKAINEVYRILKKNGYAKIMIYHKYSFIGFMLWIRYALLRLKPSLSLKTIYATYLESPGTKAYSIKEAKEMFGKFKDVEIKTVLSHGDLLSSSAGQRHEGILLTIARTIWPRWIINKVFKRYGLFMLINAEK